MVVVGSGSSSLSTWPTWPCTFELGRCTRQKWTPPRAKHGASLSLSLTLSNSLSARYLRFVIVCPRYQDRTLVLHLTVLFLTVLDLFFTMLAPYTGIMGRFSRPLRPFFLLTKVKWLKEFSRSVYASIVR